MLNPNNERYRIFCIEDAKISRELIKNELEKKYDLFFAEDAESAINSILEVRPDLILMDVHLPGMSGFELCVQIKSKEYLKDIPVIFITGLKHPEQIVQGFESGGIDYLTKPFSSLELHARVDNQFKIMQTSELRIENERLKTAQALIASLNHEINNPLAIATGNIELLMEKVSNNETEKTLKTVDGALERIANILKKINKLEDL